MKKKVKLFSSALALGMLLGTGAGSLSVVTQQVPGTTMTAKAAEGPVVELSEDQVIVDDDGYIIDIVNLSQDDVEAIAASGKLNIPSKGIMYDDEDIVVTIRGITEDMFSKDNLQSILDLENFDGLKSVTFADDSAITDIRESAFEGNQLTDITLPKGLENIEPRAFKDNQLTSVTLPENLQTIQYEAFQNNKLTEIALPKSLQTIESAAFQNNQLTDITLPENLQTIEPETFKDNQLTNATLPETVEEIGTSAFQNNQLTSIEFPDSVTEIQSDAFRNNQLEKVELSAVQYVYSDAFAENKIKAISINKGHKYIGSQSGTVNNPNISGAFTDQNWGDLTLDYSPTISGQELIDKLNLKLVKNDLEGDTIKGSVENIRSATNIGWGPEESSDSSRYLIAVKSKDGGTATIDLDAYNHYWNLSGSVGLTVNPDSNSGGDGSESENNNNGGGGSITQPDNNNNNNGGTTQPDTDNNNNNTPSTPTTPGTSNDHPYSVYATRAMRLHKNVSLTSPTKSYKKQSRAKAPSFKIQGVAYDKNGKKRYKVSGGYITASSKYVADSHFRSNKVRQVRVLSNRVNSYKDVKLSKNQKVRSYKKGTKIKVSRIVKYGRTTRFQLPNGRYITGNKQLLIMDQK